MSESARSDEGFSRAYTRQSAALVGGGMALVAGILAAVLLVAYTRGGGPAELIFGLLFGCGSMAGLAIWVVAFRRTR